MLSRSALLLLLSAPLSRALPAHKHQEARYLHQSLEEEESSEESRATVHLRALDDQLDALTHAVGELVTPSDEATARANYEMYGDELGAAELEREMGTLAGQLQDCFKIAGDMAGCELDDSKVLDPTVRAGRPHSRSPRGAHATSPPLSFPPRPSCPLARPAHASHHAATAQTITITADGKSGTPGEQADAWSSAYFEEKTKHPQCKKQRGPPTVSFGCCKCEEESRESCRNSCEASTDKAFQLFADGSMKIQNCIDKKYTDVSSGLDFGYMPGMLNAGESKGSEFFGKKGIDIASILTDTTLGQKTIALEMPAGQKKSGKHTGLIIGCSHGCAPSPRRSAPPLTPLPTPPPLRWHSFGRWHTASLPTPDLSTTSSPSPSRSLAALAARKFTTRTIRPTTITRASHSGGNPMANGLGRWTERLATHSCVWTCGTPSLARSRRKPP